MPHLLTPAVFRVIAVQCKTLKESCLCSQNALKEENNTSEWQWIWHSDANPVEPRLTVHRSLFFLHGLFLHELHYVWRYLETVPYCSASRLFKWARGFFPYLSWTHVHLMLVSQSRSGLSCLKYISSHCSDLPYLPVYKSTFEDLKISTKIRPRLIHGSKLEIQAPVKQLA